MRFSPGPKAFFWADAARIVGPTPTGGVFRAGMSKPGKTLIAPLQREIHEELGLTLRSFSFLTTIEIAKPAASFHLYTVTT